MTAAALPEWRQDLAAVRALLRRDALAASRQGLHVGARGMAVGLFAVALALGAADSGRTPPPSLLPNVATWLVATAWLATAALVPVAAVDGLRRERAAGMLDVLLLSGVRPVVLVAGRVVSTAWLLALPALGVAPVLATLLPADAAAESLRRLGAGLALGSGPLAAVAVAISAWTRRTGWALALSGVVAAGTSVMMFGRATWRADGSPAPPPGSAAAFVLGTEPAPWITALLAVAATVALIALGAAGLQRGDAAPQARGPKGAAPAGPVASPAFEGAMTPAVPRRVTWSPGHRPLTALARKRLRAGPAVQVIAFAVAAAFLGGAAVVLLVLGGLAATTLVAASRVPSEREGRTWESFLSTRASGREVATDLVLASLLPAWPAMAVAAAMIAVGAAAGGGAVGFAAVPGTLLGIAATWWLAAACGTWMSLRAPSAAIAIVGTGGMLLAYVVAAAAARWSYAVLATAMERAGGLRFPWALAVAACLALHLPPVWRRIPEGLPRRLALSALGLVAAVPIAWSGESLEGLGRTALPGAVLLAIMVASLASAWRATTLPVARALFGTACLAVPCLAQLFPESMTYDLAGGWLGAVFMGSDGHLLPPLLGGLATLAAAAALARALATHFDALAGRA